MAATPYVMMLTEKWDEAAVKWFLQDATVDDLTGPDGKPLFGPNDEFCRRQGLGGEHFNAETALNLLKQQVKSWSTHGGKVFYRYGANYADCEGGRLCASSGYQNWPKVLRSTFARGQYWDIDIHNAQPTILAFLCHSNGWPCPYLTSYCEDREGTLAKVTAEAACTPALTKDEVKELILAAICGCAPSRIAGKGDWLQGLWQEVKGIQDRVWEVPEYQQYKPGVAKSQEAKAKAMGAKAAPGYDNSRGALLAIVMQTKEKEILLAVASRLAMKHQRHMDTLIHDGGLVRKLVGETGFPQPVLDDVMAHVLEEKGIKIRLLVKPWGQALSMTEEGKPKPVKMAGGGAGQAARLAGAQAEAQAGQKRRRDSVDSSGSSSGSSSSGREGSEDGDEEDEEDEEEDEEDDEEEPSGSEAEEASEEEEDEKNLLCPGVTKTAYAAMKLEFEESHFYYVPTNTIVEVTDQGLRYYQIPHAKEYLDTKWAIGGKKNFRYRVSFLDLWRQDPERRVIHRVDFKPSEDPTVFYMPVVFKYEKYTDGAGAGAGAGDQTADDAQCLSLFDELITLAAGSDDTLKQYLLNYLAHLVQQPLENPGVAIILTGQKGIGKDTLLDFFRLYVVGEQFSHNYTETRQFFDKHDIDRKDKFFIKLEDSDSALVKSHAKDLRARITAIEGTINPKGKDPLTFPNYARYFFTANQANPVGINDDNDRERRFVILPVDSTRKGDFTFFSTVHKLLYTERGGWLVANLLKQRDLAGFNPRALPENVYQEELYEAERTLEQRFVEDKWKVGTEYDSKRVHEAYVAYALEEGVTTFTDSAIDFGRKLTPFVRDKILAKRTGGQKRTFYKKIKAVVEAGAGDDAMAEDTGAGAGAGAGATGGGSPAYQPQVWPKMGLGAPVFAAATTTR